MGFEEDNKKENNGENFNEPDLINHWHDSIGRPRPALIDLTSTPVWSYFCFAVIFFALAVIVFLKQDYKIETKNILLFLLGASFLIVGLLNLKK